MVKNVVQKILEKNALPLLVQVVAFFVVVLNLWVLTKLSPIVQDIVLINRRVDAVEERNAKVDPLVERFIQLEERDKELVEDVEQIKIDTRELLRIHIGR